MRSIVFVLVLGAGIFAIVPGSAQDAASGEKIFVRYEQGVLGSYRVGLRERETIARSDVLMAVVYAQIEGFFDSVMRSPRPACASPSTWRRSRSTSATRACRSPSTPSPAGACWKASTSSLWAWPSTSITCQPKAAHLAAGSSMGLAGAEPASRQPNCWSRAPECSGCGPCHPCGRLRGLLRT